MAMRGRCLPDRRGVPRWKLYMIGFVCVFWTVIFFTGFVLLLAAGVSDKRGEEIAEILEHFELYEAYERQLRKRVGSFTVSTRWVSGDPGSFIVAADGIPEFDEAVVGNYSTGFDVAMARNEWSEPVVLTPDAADLPPKPPTPEDGFPPLVEGDPEYPAFRRLVYRARGADALARVAGLFAPSRVDLSQVYELRMQPIDTEGQPIGEPAVRALHTFVSAEVHLGCTQLQRWRTCKAADRSCSTYNRRVECDQESFERVCSGDDGSGRAPTGGENYRVDMAPIDDSDETVPICVKLMALDAWRARAFVDGDSVRFVASLGDVTAPVSTRNHDGLIAGSGFDAFDDGGFTWRNDGGEAIPVSTDIGIPTAAFANDAQLGGPLRSVSFTPLSNEALVSRLDLPVDAVQIRPRDDPVAFVQWYTQGLSADYNFGRSYHDEVVTGGLLFGFALAFAIIVIVVNRERIRSFLNSRRAPAAGGDLSGKGGSSDGDGDIGAVELGATSTAGGGGQGPTTVQASPVTRKRAQTTQAGRPRANTGKKRVAGGVRRATAAPGKAGTVGKRRATGRGGSRRPTGRGGVRRTTRGGGVRRATGAGGVRRGTGKKSLVAGKKSLVAGKKSIVAAKLSPVEAAAAAAGTGAAAAGAEAAAAAVAAAAEGEAADPEAARRRVAEAQAAAETAAAKAARAAALEKAAEQRAAAAEAKAAAALKDVTEARAPAAAGDGSSSGSSSSSSSSSDDDDSTSDSSGSSSSGGED